MEKISLFVGPELDFKLAVYNDREKWEDDPFETSTLVEAVGASYNFNSQIGIDARYVHGFMDIIDVDLRDENNTPLGRFNDGQHRLFQLSVFYFF